MAGLCTSKTYALAPLMKFSNTEIRNHIEQLAAEDTLAALHLCHQILAAQHLYPSRPALVRTIGQCLTRLGKIIENQPERG